MIIWHNPECSKSRECVKVLDEKGILFTTREYLIDCPTKKELEEIIGIMAIKDIRDMIRVKEEEYKALDLSNKEKSDKELIDAMIMYPKLIERPIGINNGKARVGRPLENILELM